MTEDRVIDAVAGGLFTILISAAPPLIMGLSVGLIVAIFQTVTSIQEQTLAFVPKIVAVMFSLIIFGYFMLTTLYEYVNSLLGSIPGFIQSLH